MVRNGDTPQGGDRRPLGPAARIAVIAIVVPPMIIGLASGYGALAVAPYAAVGAFLAIRRPGNTIGWLLIALAWAFAVSFVNVPATEAELVGGTVSASTMAIATLTSWASSALLVLFFVVTIVFPSGRLPTGRWGRLARIGLAALVASAVLAAVAPTITANVADSSSGVQIHNPLAILPDSALWAFVGGLGFQLAMALAGVASMVVRLRRARGVERAQLRWVVLALALILVGLIVGIVGGAVFENGLNGLVWIPAEIAFVLPPIAIGVAILRYRLYDIDRVISRTISWAVVTVVLATSFVLAILVAQALLAPVTGSNQLAVAASTLVVAALFQPIRRRVQRLVDRRFNRARYDAERTVNAFAGRLRDEVDLEELRAEILATVSQAVEPTTVSLWLRA